MIELATEDRRGPGALAFAAPVFSQLYDRLKALPLLPGQGGWAVGDVTRGNDSQTADLADGLTDLAYPLSGHNQVPAQAVDFWPYDDTQDQAVIGNVDYFGYRLLEQEAQALGLETGRAWGDGGHVVVPSYDVPELQDPQPSRARGGLLLLLAAIAIAVSQK